MHEINSCTSAPRGLSYYKEQTVINGITILFTEINGIKEGPAKAIYPAYTIKFKYVMDLKQGKATQFFPDGTQIHFTYVNDQESRAGYAIFPDGTREDY